MTLRTYLLIWSLNFRRDCLVVLNPLPQVIWIDFLNSSLEEQVAMPSRDRLMGEVVHHSISFVKPHDMEVNYAMPYWYQLDFLPQLELLFHSFNQAV